MSDIKKKTDIKHYSSEIEEHVRLKMLDLLQNCPIPKDQLLSNIENFFRLKKICLGYFFLMKFIKRL